jgi:hypothetical protein
VFLNRLAEREKRGFIELALLAVRADGCITSEEVQFVEELRLAVGLAEDDFVQKILSEPSFDHAVSAFESEESRRLAHLELVALMYADHEYNPSESAFLRRLESTFKFDAMTIANHQEWARRYIRLRTDALALAQAGGPH